MEGKTCGCPCHKGAGGWIVAIIGLAFLLQNFNILTPEVVSIIWPIGVILLGLKMSCRCCAGNHEMMK